MTGRFTREAARTDARTRLGPEGVAELVRTAAAGDDRAWERLVEESRG